MVGASVGAAVDADGADVGDVTGAGVGDVGGLAVGTGVGKSVPERSPHRVHPLRTSDESDLQAMTVLAGMI